MTQDSTLKQQILRGVAAQNFALERNQPPPDPSTQTARTRTAAQRRAQIFFGGVLLIALLLSSLLERPARNEPPISPPVAQQQTTTELPFPRLTLAAPEFAPEALRRAVDRPQKSTDALLRGGDFLQFSQFPLATLLGLSVRTILIDPGHGGRDPGAIGLNGTQEKDLVLDIALRLYARLQQHPHYRVLLTRDHDRSLSLRQRVEMANQMQADLFLSLHFNVLPQRSINLVETYYFGTEVTKHTAAIVAKENRGSQITMNEFNTLMAQVGDRLKIQESRLFATAIQRALFAELRQHDPHIIDAGIKSAPFLVLLGLRVPGVLAEISCLSHPPEEERLNSGQYRERIAAALEQGVLDYLDPSWHPDPTVLGDVLDVRSDLN